MHTKKQIQAAAQDPRVIVCPVTFDPSPIPQKVFETYQALGATETMSMGALLAR